MQHAFLQELAHRLGAVAKDLHEMLELDNEQLQGLQTIIHGDFKTANLFFSPDAGDNGALYSAYVCSGSPVICHALTGILRQV